MNVRPFAKRRWLPELPRHSQKFRTHRILATNYMVFAGIFGLAWWPLLEPVWIYSLHTQVSLYHSFLRTSRKYDLLGQTFQQLSTLRPTRQGLFVVTIIVNKQLYWKLSTSNNVLVRLCIVTRRFIYIGSCLFT